jgi:hypothetical protein
LGGNVSAVRIRGDGIEWAFAGGTTSGSGTLGSAKAGAEIATGTVIPGAKFQLVVNRDNSADLVAPVIALVPFNANNDPVRLAEGSGANRDFTFTITRTGSLTGASSVAWAVSGVTFFAPTAAGAADFVGGTLPGGTVNFAASESAKTITVTANGDSDIETAEGFRVVLSAPSGATLGSVSEVYGVIENDDGSPVLDIAATDANKTEGNSGSTPFTFTVTRSGNLGLAVSVNWAVSAVGFPFVFITDFVPQGNPQGTLNFAAQETSKVITINVAGEVEPEPNKEFRVTLSGPTGGATLGTASAIGTILDDDATLAISARIATRSEGNAGAKPFKFAVQRNAQATQLINGITTVNWTVTGSATQSGTTPAGPGDFTGNVLTNAVLTFAAGETEKEIEVLVNGNTSSQGNREFTVTLSSPSDAATLLTPTAVGIILDDDTNPAIVDTFASPLFNLRTVNVGTNYAVAFTTDNQVWQLGSVAVQLFAFLPSTLLTELRTDADGVPGTVLESWSVPVSGFSLRLTNQSVTLPLLQASTKYWVVFTPSGNFIDLETGGPVDNAGLGTINEQIGAIVFPDSVPFFAVRGLTAAQLAASLSVAATAAVKAEGNPGTTTPFTFTITRSGILTNVNSVAWAVTGTGLRPANGTDFAGSVLPTGMVSFAPNETNKIITVSVSGDTLAEGDETFTVTLSNPSNGALLGGPTATGTILADDAELRLEAVNPDRLEGAGQWQYQVRRSGATNGTTTVNWAVTGSGGAAADGTDFGGVLPSGTVTFNPGDTVVPVNFNVVGDTTVEPDETFVVTLAGASAGARVVIATAGGVIRNDDTAVSLAVLDADKVEGNAGAKTFTFQLTRTGSLTAATTVNFAVAGSGPNPAAAADFVGAALPANTITLNPGVSTMALTINVAGDTTAEADEGFTVTISNPTGGATISNATATGNIRNDDTGAGTLIVSSFANQGTGFHDPVAEPDTQAQSFTNGPQDFVLGSVALRLALPDNSVPNVTADILLLADNGPVRTDMFSNITRPTPGTVLATIGTVQINRVFPQAALTAQDLLDLTVTVPASSNVTLTANTTYWIGVRPTAPSGGSVAMLSWLDFNNPVQGVGTMGSLGANLFNTGMGGRFVLGGSFLAVTAAAPAGAPTLAIAANNADQLEGQAGTTPFTFTITRGGTTTGSTTVNWAVSAGSISPAGADDFQGSAFPSGSVTFAAGETSKDISIQITGDATVEADEDFVVTLSSPTGGAQILAAMATGVIRSDETTFAISAPDADQPEGSGGSTPFRFTITRNGRVDSAQSVNWVVTGSGSSPANAADFVGNVLTNGAAQFAAGERTKDIVVLVNADTDNERDEAFTLTLTAATGGAVIQEATATGFIRNDDPLAIVAGGGFLQIAWGVGALSNYVLESSDSLTSPNWIVVAQAPDVGDGQASTILPLQGSGRFFRLRKLP